MIDIFTISFVYKTCFLHDCACLVTSGAFLFNGWFLIVRRVRLSISGIFVRHFLLL